MNQSNFVSLKGLRVKTHRNAIGQRLSLAIGHGICRQRIYLRTPVLKLNRIVAIWIFRAFLAAKEEQSSIAPPLTGKTVRISIGAEQSFDRGSSFSFVGWDFAPVDSRLAIAPDVLLMKNRSRS